MKKNLLKLLGISLISLLLVGCNSNIHDSESNVSEHGINVRSLGSGTDGDGHEYKTYAYVVVPSNSTTPIAASVSFADSRADGASYLTATVDNAIKEFTITCIAPFDSQATVRIYATIGSAYANVTVDYRQKLVSSTFDSGFTVGTSATTSLFWGDFSSGHAHLTASSVYTLANTFTYTGLKSATLKSNSVFVNGISQDPGHEAAVIDITADFTSMLGTWLAYSLKNAQGDQADKDLYEHVESLISGLTTFEKNVLGSAESSGLIKITFTCSAMEHYYNSSLANELSFAVATDTTMSFNIPSALYNTLGVYKAVATITPSISSVEF